MEIRYNPKADLVYIRLDERKQEVTVAFAGAGAVLLLVASGLSALWFGRLP